MDNGILNEETNEISDKSNFNGNVSCKERKHLDAITEIKDKQHVWLYINKLFHENNYSIPIH